MIQIAGGILLALLILCLIPVAIGLILLPFKLLAATRADTDRWARSLGRLIKELR